MTSVEKNASPSVTNEKSQPQEAGSCCQLTRPDRPHGPMVACKAQTETGLKTGVFAPPFSNTHTCSQFRNENPYPAMLAPKHLQDSHLVVMMAKESYSFVIVTDVILMWNPIMLLLLLLCYCNDVPDNQHLMGG